MTFNILCYSRISISFNTALSDVLELSSVGRARGHCPEVLGSIPGAPTFFLKFKVSSLSDSDRGKPAQMWTISSIVQKLSDKW